LFRKISETCDPECNCFTKDKIVILKIIEVQLEIRRRNKKPKVLNTFLLFSVFLINGGRKLLSAPH